MHLQLSYYSWQTNGPTSDPDEMIGRVEDEETAENSERAARNEDQPNELEALDVDGIGRFDDSSNAASCHTRDLRETGKVVGQKSDNDVADVLRRDAGLDGGLCDGSGGLRIRL